MDTNQNHNQFHIPNKKPEQEHRRKKWNARQIAFPFFINPLISTDGKK